MSLLRFMLVGLGLMRSRVRPTIRLFQFVGEATRMQFLVESL